MTKSVTALLLMLSAIATAQTGPAYANDQKAADWPSGKKAILFLPQHFDSVPWLGLPPSPKLKVDLLLPTNVEKIGALKLDVPATQFSVNTRAETARLN